MSDDTELKEQVRKFLEFVEELGIVEETGQTYKKVYLKALFDNDNQTLYTMIENLKTMSK